MKNDLQDGNCEGESFLDEFEIGKTFILGSLTSLFTPFLELYIFFLEDLELCQAQVKAESQTEEGASNSEDKLKPKRIAKHDVRRYFTRMFFNAINSTNFTTLLDYLNTFMKEDCEFALEYTAPFEVENWPKRMSAKGPRLSAFYLSCVGALFPDMVLSLITCQLVTSTAWTGTKLVVSSRLQYTKIYDISFDNSMKQLAMIYIAHKRECNQKAVVKVEVVPVGEKVVGAFAEALQEEEGHQTKTLEPPVGESLPADAASCEQREGRAKFQKTPNSDDVLVAKMHDFISRINRLVTGKTFYADCKFTIMLDEQNHMENILVSAVQGVM